MNNPRYRSPYPVILLMALFVSCSDQFTGTLFKGQSPHQRYLNQLSRAGLAGSTLYRQWFQSSVFSLTDPTVITVPHQESVYIARHQPTAIGYAFRARQGEQLRIAVVTNSTDSARLFIDLFEAARDTASKPKHVISADTATTTLTWDVQRDGQYILRVQPELFAELSFDLRLTAEASLANPVAPEARQHIGSVFGDPRDGGHRKHEGIDIFAARSTPVVAAADGIVRVGDNRLGGKVIWLRPKGRPLNLYYAHLDSQFVASGQTVRIGDTLGLMGNTGNARTTPPHLHFGIYALGGAVDPLPFVRPGKSTPPAIVSDISRIGDTLRTVTALHRDGLRYVPVRIEAAYRNGYRVVFPDSTKHFLTPKQVAALTRLRTVQLDRPHRLYAQPDTTAARITELKTGEQARVVGEFGDFLLVDKPNRGWIQR